MFHRLILLPNIVPDQALETSIVIFAFAFFPICVISHFGGSIPMPMPSLPPFEKNLIRFT